ncbi:BDF_1d_G0043840.mRNA.1.CDS.1 [Saccharomyces cerevisiae]|nr:BDF_1d_G0043840.mRNA.1.CDS.1 [Saccharomyces cerevisiae]CAI7293877.1 BDF_1d_G0043840.mRNA.1.CDS.1 [Saccharomyces cerevisiae]
MTWEKQLDMVDRSLEKALEVGFDATQNNTTSSDLIKNVETARSTIDGLIESLEWIELNYRCERQCNWDEVCYTPY